MGASPSPVKGSTLKSDSYSHLPTRPHTTGTYTRTLRVAKGILQLARQGAARTNEKGAC